MISWRRCSIAHPLEPTPLDVASGDWPKLIAALKSPSKSTLSLTREILESRRNQVFTSQKLPLKGTRHTWSLLLVILSLLASGTPTRSSQGPPRGGRDTGPIPIYKSNERAKIKGRQKKRQRKTIKKNKRKIKGRQKKLYLVCPNNYPPSSSPTDLKWLNANVL